MILYTDSREQDCLVFDKFDGVKYQTTCLSVGDYSALYVVDGKEVMSDTVFERKSVADLFGSFSGKHYERERAKMIRYRDAGFRFYVLAVEANIFDVRVGHTYIKGGVEYTVKKDGLSMLRQLCTCSHKYGIIPMFFNGRKEMAFWIQEYFLAKERVKHEKDRTKEGVERSLAERKALVGESAVFGCREPEETGDNGQEEA